MIGTSRSQFADADADELRLDASAAALDGLAHWMYRYPSVALPSEALTDLLALAHMMCCESLQRAVEEVIVANLEPSTCLDMLSHGLLSSQKSTTPG